MEAKNARFTMGKERVKRIGIAGSAKNAFGRRLLDGSRLAWAEAGAVLSASALAALLAFSCAPKGTVKLGHPGETGGGDVHPDKKGGIVLEESPEHKPAAKEGPALLEEVVVDGTPFPKELGPLADAYGEKAYDAYEMIMGWEYSHEEIMGKLGMGAKEYSGLLGAFQKAGIFGFSGNLVKMESEFGEDGIAMYILVDGKRTMGEIAEEIGISESEMLEMYYYMKDNWIIQNDDYPYPSDIKAGLKDSEPEEFAVPDVYPDGHSLALAYARAGKGGKAKALANKLLQGTEEGGDPAYAGEVFIELGDREGLEECALQLEEDFKHLGPFEARILAGIYLSLAGMEENEFEKSILQEKAVKVVGARIEGKRHYDDAVELYLSLGEREKAEEALEKCKAQCIKGEIGANPAAWRMLARSYVLLGNNDAARGIAEGFEEADDLKSAFEIYRGAGQYAGALRVLRQVEKSELPFPKDIPGYDRAMFYVDLAELAPFLSDLKQKSLHAAWDTARKHCDDAEAALVYARLAKALYKQGAREDAMERIAVLKVKGQFEEAAAALLCLGESAEAAKAIKKAIWKDNLPEGSFRNPAIGLSIYGGEEELAKFAGLFAETGSAGSESAAQIAEYLTWEGHYDEAAEIYLKIRDKGGLEKITMLGAEEFYDEALQVKAGVALWQLTGKQKHKDRALSLLGSYFREYEGYPEEELFVAYNLCLLGEEDTASGLVAQSEIGDDPETLYKYAWVMRALGDYDSAFGAATILDIDGATEEAFLAYDAAGDTAEAAKLLDELLEEGPYEPAKVAKFISSMPAGSEKDGYMDRMYSLAEELVSEEYEDLEILGYLSRAGHVASKAYLKEYIAECKEFEDWEGAAVAYLALGSKQQANKYLAKAWGEANADEIYIHRGWVGKAFGEIGAPGT